MNSFMTDNPLTPLVTTIDPHFSYVMKYKYELRLPNACPLLQTIQESFSLTTLGNPINEKVRHSQNEETSIPEAIQQPYTNP